MNTEQNQRTGTRIVYAITANYAYVFLKGRLRYLRAHGFCPVVVTGGDPKGIGDTGVEVINVPMTREISPARDFVSLFRLWLTLRRLRPAITNVSTPKAGLLAGLAAVMAGVPHRVYVLRGLRFESARGLKRKLLVTAEWIACSCAHRVIAISNSVRRRVIADGIVKPEKVVVLVNGSEGVDTTRFAPGALCMETLDRLHASLRIPKDALVLGFVGRLTRDKGIPELVSAFQLLRQTWNNLYLLLVGDFEAGDPVDADTYVAINTDLHIIRTGFVEDTAPYYHLMDISVLPSYREGFPNVVLEAQATGVPVVTTTATGAIESIVDGVTGFLVPVGNSVLLAKAMGELLKNPGLRVRMGKAGRERVEREFRPEVIGNALLAEYRTLLNKGASAPSEKTKNIPVTVPGQTQQDIPLHRVISNSKDQTPEPSLEETVIEVGQ